MYMVPRRLGAVSKKACLKDAQSATRVQLQYLKLLHRYLKFKYEHSDFANSQLHGGVMIGSLAREREEIIRQRLPV